MTAEQTIATLRQANAAALQAMQEGHHPFAALLIAPDGETVLMSQSNINTVNHGEATLIRAAAEKYSADDLWNCTLVTTVKPCAMCAGTQY